MQARISAAACRLRRAAAAAVLLAALLGAAAVQAQPVRLGGTGSALGTMRLLSDAYRPAHPDFELEIVPSLGSTGGIRALQTGLIDVAAISRELTAEEQASGLRAVAYGKTAFVLATTKPDVESLSVAEIARIYGAAQPRWADGSPIRLVLRPATDTDSVLLAAFSPAVREALSVAMSREGMLVGMTDQDGADAIERTRGALGTTTLALVLSEQRRMRVLAIDGVRPSAAAVANGSYPYHKTMRLVVKPDATAAVTRFLAFIASPRGQRLLSATGHVPLGADGAAPDQARRR